MNKARRLFILSGAVGITALLTGCEVGRVTKSLFKDVSHSYAEAVSSVLISEDRKTIVFIGKNYHYIFDAPSILVKTLTANFHKNVSALHGGFHVDNEGIVKGGLTLSLNIKAPEQDKLSALEMGYTKRIVPNVGYFCEYEVNLTGVRYKSNGIEPTLVSQKLNKTYVFNVIAEQSSGEKAAKASLTPITVAIDGVLLIAKIPLMIPLIPLMLIFSNCYDNPDCLK
ncbi:MAG: hypothetical protein QX189_07360 [Methylococcales bacterium]